MQASGDFSTQTTSQAHPVAALSQDVLAQERTTIMGLLTDRKRRRERMPHELEQCYREHVVQRAITVMQNNRLATGLFYLFIGLLTYQQVHYVSTPQSLAHDMAIWMAIYLAGGIVFSVIGFCVSARRFDKHYSAYIGTCSFLGLSGITVSASLFNSAYINQQASYLVIFIYMLVYSLGSLRIAATVIIGVFSALFSMAVIITFNLKVDFGQYTHYTGLSNVIGLVIAFMIDQRDRRAFLQSRLIEIEKQQLNKLSQEMARISQEDALTTLANRRHFNETLAREWGVAEREKHPISLMFIDVDHFKPYNDTYGHLEGDKALSRVGRTLKKMATRPADLAARYGGEEFVLLLPNTDSEGAYILAQEVQKAIDGLNIPHRSSKAGKMLSVSIGLATLTPDESNSITLLIDNADQGVYAAKEAGRHRIRIWPKPKAVSSKNAPQAKGES